MEKYYFIELQLTTEIEDSIDYQAHENYYCQGIEEFSLEESQVDEILGERSYSGGDVPESVIYEVEEVVKSKFIQKKYYFENHGHASRFQNFVHEKYKVESQIITQDIQDWNEVWKKNYAPIFVNSEVEIIPEWEKDKITPKAKNQIYIYPGQGFGTGSHETTFLCLKIFSELEGKFTNCLDFGCGSGILGIGFKKLQPAKVVDLYDIDPDALENCRQNIQLNDFQDDDFGIYLPIQRDFIERKYEVVFANILLNVLLHEKEYLTTSLVSGGHLILSGLLNGQEDEVIEAYTKINNSLKHIKTEFKGDWVAVHLRLEN